MSIQLTPDEVRTAASQFSTNAQLLGEENTKINESLQAIIEALDTFQKNFEGHNSAIDDYRNKADTAIQAVVDGGWQGNAATSYQTVNADFSTAMQNLGTSMSNLALQAPALNEQITEIVDELTKTVADYSAMSEEVCTSMTNYANDMQAVDEGYSS